jgi:hypothetical protein
MGIILKHLYCRKFQNDKLAAAMINNNMHLAARPGENSAATDLSKKTNRADGQILEAEHRLQFPLPEEEPELVTTKSSIAINSTQRII